MKLKLDFHGVIFEYEKRPMPESRFKTLCAIAAVSMYVFLVVGVTALCGLPGLAVVAFVTLCVFAIETM